MQRTSSLLSMASVAHLRNIGVKTKPGESASFLLITRAAPLRAWYGETSTPPNGCIIIPVIQRLERQPRCESRERRAAVNPAGKGPTPDERSD
jgi:hypothetical protein